MQDNVGELGEIKWMAEIKGPGEQKFQLRV